MLVEKISGCQAGTVDLYDYDPLNLCAGVEVLIDSDFSNCGYGREAILMMHRLASFMRTANTIIKEAKDNC
jgi:hypothetical protein